MFFEKKEEVSIDGTKYQLSMGAMNDTFGCKEAMCDIYNIFDPGQMEMECNFENYTTWKKDLVKKLKEWDKTYMKHIKNTYPEMSAIHAQAMKPLMDLIVANLNFHNLENMIKAKKDVSDFRFSALEDEFITFFTGVCQIFKDYGEMNEYFNIK